LAHDWLKTNQEFLATTARPNLVFFLHSFFMTGLAIIDLCFVLLLSIF
jgi:hypothetical protein